MKTTAAMKKLNKMTKQLVTAVRLGGMTLAEAQEQEKRNRAALGLAPF